MSADATTGRSVWPCRRSQAVRHRHVIHHVTELGLCLRLPSSSVSNFRSPGRVGSSCNFRTAVIALVHECQVDCLHQPGKRTIARYSSLSVSQNRECYELRGNGKAQTVLVQRNASCHTLPRPDRWLCKPITLGSMAVPPPSPMNAISTPQ